MNQVIEFFTKLFDTSDWPPRWHFGRWTEFHGWLYITSDLLIGSAFVVIPSIIIFYISGRKDFLFKRLYILFAAFILACGLSHFMDAAAFWLPAYRLNGLIRFTTGILSWIAVYYIAKFLPKISAFRPQYELKAEIERRIFAESQVRLMNIELDKKVIERTAEINDYRYALDESCIVEIADPDGTIVYANENSCNVSGYEREELLGQNQGIFNSGFHPQSFMEQLWATIQSGKIWKDEVKNKGKQGNYFWVDTTIVPFLDETGRPYQYMTIRADITARKESEENEKALEEKIHAKNAEMTGIFDRILDGFLMVDKNYCYTYANKKIGVMVGREPASLMGKCMWEEFPDAVNSKTFKSFEKAMREQQYIFSLDYYEPFDLWQENHIYPTADGLSVFIRDITEQKRAEISLRNSEARFRRIFESNMVGFTFWNEDGSIVEANDYFLNMIGYSREDLSGKMINRKHITPPEYAETDKRFNDQINANGVAQPMEKEYYKKNGERLHVLVGGASLNKDDKEKGVSYVLNISDSKTAGDEILKLNSELQRSEKTYRTIASSIPGSVICIFDSEWRYILIEGDMLEEMGYSKEALLWKKPSDALPLQRYEAVKINFERVFRGEIFETNDKRGERFTISRWVPLKDEKGIVYGAMIVVLDVTELKQAELRIADLNRGLEQKVEERTQELDAVNKELEAFSYSVSHDLRAPLRAVNGYSNMLIEDYGSILDDEGRRVLDAVIRNSNIMGQLIDDLLRFSRIGRKEMVIYSVSMEQIVKSCMDELLSMVEENKYEFEIGELPDVAGDAAMIKQVWMNLIGNAIKYASKKTTPRIQIGSYKDQSGYIYFIKDNGVGFDMQYADKLFGVFQRLHSHSEFEGTGVGLALVNRIINKHNGKVWASSSPDEGATFFFTLPGVQEITQKSYSYERQ